MSFIAAIKTCFSKYADFSGRASLAEFWWFFLFTSLSNIVLNKVSIFLGLLFMLAVLIPALAVGARRLHDTDKSALFLLLWLLPVIGWIIVLVLMAMGPREPNRFGSASNLPAEVV